ncbi:MAG: energy transducer TonB [Pseudomonadales bacterium]|jgi:tetratricopeptide (TPR) repeat protein
MELTINAIEISQANHNTIDTARYFEQAINAAASMQPPHPGLSTIGDQYLSFLRETPECGCGDRIEETVNKLADGLEQAAADPYDIFSAYYRGARALSRHLLDLPNGYEENQLADIALDMSSELFPEGSTQWIEAQLVMATVLSDSLLQRKRAKARMLAQDALEALDENFPSNEQASYRQLAHHLMGTYYLSENRLSSAEDSFSAVLEAKEYHNQDIRYVLSAHANLVNIYSRRGEEERATEHCIAISESRPHSTTEEPYAIYKPARDYPQRLLRENVEGSVLVEFNIDAAGQTSDLTIIESELPIGDAKFENTRFTRLIEEASLEEVSNYRYAPRLVDGAPTAVAGVQYRVVYALVKKRGPNPDRSSTYTRIRN